MEMQKLLLLTKIPPTNPGKLRQFQKELTYKLEDLSVTIQRTEVYDDGFIELILDGEDEVAAKNYLAKLYGRAIPLDELNVGDTLKGFICSSGKVGFGLFVDIGIKKPYAVDALIPLFTLRKQLVEGKKISARKIIELYGLIDHLPLEITIEQVSIALKKIEAKLSEQQVKRFQKWQEEGLERLLILGASKGQIKKALEQTKHEKDIIEIERLGWAEYALSCKFNTTARGLIPELGRALPRVKFEIFSPAKIRKVLREQKE